MILFNANKTEQDVILTLSEASTGDTFNLKLESPYDTKEIELSNDVSPNPNRYNHYIIPTSLVLGLQKGVIYSFKVYDGESTPVESGTAKLIDDTPEQVIKYQKDKEEIIIYKR